MELHPRDPGRSAWALPCLLLLALPGVGAQTGQDFKLHQPQDKVSVKAGETLTLNCTMSGTFVPGPVKWLKGWGSENKTVYGDTGSYPRVTRAVSESNTDFTIYINNVQPEDAGTYYCVKFEKTVGRGDVLLQYGNGTEVSVHAKPSTPLVSGPKKRAGPGQSVAFNCTAGGFFPKDISVKWLKDRTPISSHWMPQVTEWQKQSYNMSSSVTLVLGEGDALSNLICEVQHSASPTVLRGTYRLSRVLRVPPKVDVSTDQTGPIQVNKTVNFTCHVKGFYPEQVSVSWLESKRKIKEENNPRPSMSRQGLFELRSWVEVQATEDKNGTVFTCMVEHDAQAPVNHTVTLWIASPDQEELSKFHMDNENVVIYSVVAVVCLVLALLVAAILYLIRTKQIKGKSSPSARLHEPEKSSEATTQESDPNNLTYADLNFEKERKTIRRMVEMSQQSEYACIQTNQAPNGDDNLTYADLDMVHLSKAPKRPAPRPEEASSEYASVQIPRK